MLQNIEYAKITFLYMKFSMHKKIFCLKKRPKNSKKRIKIALKRNINSSFSMSKKIVHNTPPQIEKKCITLYVAFKCGVCRKALK